MAGIVLNNIAASFIGNTEVKSIYLGPYKIYESMQKLSTPTNESISSDIYSCDIVEHATAYEVIATRSGYPDIVVGTYQGYSINAVATNITASASNPNHIMVGGTVELRFTTDGVAYKVPTDMPTITGATGTYNKISDSECVITLTNPTGNVSFSISGEEIIFPSYVLLPKPQAQQ